MSKVGDTSTELPANDDQNLFRNKSGEITMIKNNQNRIARMIAVAVPMLCVVLTGHADCRGQKIVLSGKVIAYENSLLRVTRLTDVPREETFFVKVEKVLKGKESSKFIKIKYSYLGEKNALPESLLEGKNRWKFVLLRNQECDQTGVAENPAVSLVKLNENEELSQSTTFPCYLLAKGKLKAINN